MQSRVVIFHSLVLSSEILSYSIEFLSSLVLVFLDLLLKLLLDFLIINPIVNLNNFLKEVWSVVVFNRSPNNSGILFNKRHLKHKWISCCLLIFENQIWIHFVISLYLSLATLIMISKIIQEHIIRILCLVKSLIENFDNFIGKSISDIKISHLNIFKCSLFFFLSNELLSKNFKFFVIIFS